MMETDKVKFQDSLVHCLSFQTVYVFLSDSLVQHEGKKVGSFQQFIFKGLLDIVYITWVEIFLKI